MESMINSLQTKTNVNIDHAIHLLIAPIPSAVFTAAVFQDIPEMDFIVTVSHSVLIRSVHH